MKLHHTEYKKNYKTFILNTIEEGQTDAEKLQHILDRFESEYGFNVAGWAVRAQWRNGCQVLPLISPSTTTRSSSLLSIWDLLTVIA